MQRFRLCAADSISIVDKLPLGWHQDNESYYELQNHCDYR